MRFKRFMDILETVYSVLLMLVGGLYVLWTEFESSLGAPPAWLYTALWGILIPSAVLLLKEGISFLVHLLKAGEPDA